MIQNYRKYVLSNRELFLFFGLGFPTLGFACFLFFHSFILAFAAGFLILRLQPLYEKYLAAARMQKLTFQFKDLLYSLSASVSSGRQMSEAIVEACDNLQVMYGDDEPIMMELRHMKRSILENNESDRMLLADFAERSGHEDIINFVQVYVTCRNLGGDLEKIISRTSEIITDKINIQREIRAITSQKKLEGRLIALMPVAMLLALNLMSPAYIAPLYSGFAGRMIMAGCIAAGIYGVHLMEKISDVEV